MLLKILLEVSQLLVLRRTLLYAHIMRKLEKIELEMPSIDRVNELDRKIQGNLNRLDNSMQKIVKTLETIKSLDEKSSRIEKIEEVIETLGTTFSSIKTKKDETPTKKEPKSVYVPKVPRAKASTPSAKTVETVKTLEEALIFNFNETPTDFPPFDFIPRSIFIRPLFEKPIKTSCTIEEHFDDNGNGSIDAT